MTDAKHIARTDVPVMSGKVVDEGGELRLLVGSEHGLQVSVMQSVVVPGGGPRRHRHPHAEIFVVEAGLGRFEVDGETLEAESGDILIVPPDAWHGFTNTGSEPLRLIAIHENPRATTEWEDGRRLE